MMQLLVLGSLISVAVVKQPSSAQPAKTMKILALRSFICAAVILSRTRKGKEVADGIAEEVKERGRKFMDLFSVREKNRKREAAKKDYETAIAHNEKIQSSGVSQDAKNRAIAMNDVHSKERVWKELY